MNTTEILAGTETPKRPRRADATMLPTALNVRRLVGLRSIAIPGPAICLLIAGQIYDLGIPVAPLLTIIVATVAVNIWTWQRLKSPRQFSHNEFFVQMLVDVAALSTILYYSGGASNPFAFFFLLPLTITATVLPRRYAWLMAVTTACCYTLLMFFRRSAPFLAPRNDQAIFDLHVAGMWLGFVVIAGLIAHYVVGMGETLRDRERRLAEARERALEDERVLALAALAAGAAHEIGTPLATMQVIVGELGQDGAGDERTRRQLKILREQIDRCKDALSVMSASSGIDRAEDMRPARLDKFLRQTIDDVRNLRPDARIALEIDAVPVPEILVERTLSQAVLNVMHNAVDVSPGDVSVIADRDTAGIRIRVLDRGPGIEPGSLRAEPRTTKPAGLGVGLFISRAALHQVGGELTLSNRDGGGCAAEIHWPASRIRT